MLDARCVGVMGVEEGVGDSGVLVMAEGGWGSTVFWECSTFDKVFLTVLTSEIKTECSDFFSLKS